MFGVASAGAWPWTFSPRASARPALRPVPLQTLHVMGTSAPQSGISRSMPSMQFGHFRGENVGGGVPRREQGAAADHWSPPGTFVESSSFILHSSSMAAAPPTLAPKESNSPQYNHSSILLDPTSNAVPSENSKRRRFSLAIFLFLFFSALQIFKIVLPFKFAQSSDSTHSFLILSK